MNLGAIASAIAVGVCVVALVWQAILLWVRGDRFRYFDSMPPGMPMSPALWKHYVRTMPVMAVGSIFFAGAALIAAVANGLGTVILGACSFLLVLGVAPVIFLFNWPKALVPPACRGESGWISERREKR